MKTHRVLMSKDQSLVHIRKAIDRPMRMARETEFFTGCLLEATKIQLKGLANRRLSQPPASCPRHASNSARLAVDPYWTSLIGFTWRDDL